MSVLNQQIIEDIALPINGELPCGLDPRSDTSPLSQYYRLKEVRTRTRADERSALIGIDSDETMNDFVREWSPIKDEIPQILAQETKDLEYCAWLIEALCRTDGFAGLTIGFTLAHQLISQFWDGLYPSPDEDGLETRIAPLLGLNGFEGEGVLLMPILSIPLVETGSGERFPTWQIEQASQLNSLSADKQKAKIANGAVSLKQIKEALNEVSDDELVSLKNDIAEAIIAFRLLADKMDEVMSGDAQPTSKITEKLQHCESIFTFITLERFNVINAEAAVEASVAEQVAEDAVELDAASHSAGASAQAKSVNGYDFMQMDQSLNNRHEAIKALHKIEQYFRTTEPHSPISYAIAQAIRWSELSLPELLAELVSDPNARTDYFKLTGITQGEET
ncbi:MAG: type VI secretion system protein TssA [Moritella sp.]|nr:MAG: type VI secretion system protein TssA [Moritella sp.]